MGPSAFSERMVFVWGFLGGTLPIYNESVVNEGATVVKCFATVVNTRASVVNVFESVVT